MWGGRESVSGERPGCMLSTMMHYSMVPLAIHVMMRMRMSQRASRQPADNDVASWPVVSG